MTIKQVPSPNHTEATGRPIDLLVIHSMEIAEKGDTAEACAAYFAKPVAKASSHYCIDNDSVVQCVSEEDVAWAAPGANHDGIQLEHAGFARQNLAEWSDPYSKAMLKQSAQLAAGICKRHKIPLVPLLAPQLAAGMRGITTHLEVSRAFGLSTHWDPGFSFPMGTYVAAVKAFGVTPAPPVKEPEPTLRPGDTGWRVSQVQRLLNAAHQNIPVDGKFGHWTEVAVKAFQKHVGLPSDGIVGPRTWRALWMHRYLEGAERPGH